MDVTVTQNQIVDGLRECGIEANDVLFVHSSLSAFGHVEGGAPAVIAALQSVLGEGGTLMMPSFFLTGSHYETVRDPSCRFDVRSSPSRMGKITDVFWRMPDVRRSLHPTHSVSAWGKRRDEVIAGHEKSMWACGVGTPMFRLIELDAKILLLGATHKSCTFIHTIEDTGPTPSTSLATFEPVVVDYDGRDIKVPTHPHLPGMGRDYSRADAFCAERGIQRETMIGSARVIVIQARPFYEAAQEALKKDPLFFVMKEHYLHRANASAD